MENVLTQLGLSKSQMSSQPLISQTKSTTTAEASMRQQQRQFPPPTCQPEISVADSLVTSTATQIINAGSSTLHSDDTALQNPYV